MKLTDLKNRLLKSFSRGEEPGSRRPDGGTSCYRPIRRRTQAEVPEQQAEQQQPMTYIHTGFTGMNPPSSGYDTGFGMEAYGRQQQPYGQPGPFSQPAYTQQQSGQTAYTQAAFGQNSYGQSPYDQTAFNQNAYGQNQYNQTSYSSQPPFGQNSSYTQHAGRVRAEQPEPAAARPERGWFPPREEAVPRSNISYMPGYAPDAGAAPFNHVEHIMTMTGLKSCYEAIECMKNGETLIVSLDAIANENESMRCQDMLAGAAFTLGCNVRMLQGARLVLIAPETVKILPEEVPARPEMTAPPVYTPAQQTQEAPRQRERRNGRNAADWNAARNGQMDNYNPYTGTMPVAAGSYANFGGYGY